MKSSISFLLGVLVLLSITSIELSAMDPGVKIMKIAFSKKMNIQIASIKTETTILFRTANGITLIEDQVLPQQNFDRVFDLKDLPDGFYTIEIRDWQKEITQPIEVVEEEIFILYRKRKEIFSPFIQQRSHLVDVSLLNPAIDDVKIKVIDDWGNTVFESEMKQVMKVEKRLNLKDLDRGNYIVIVSTSHKSYYKDIFLR